MADKRSMRGTGLLSAFAVLLAVTAPSLGLADSSYTSLPSSIQLSIRGAAQRSDAALHQEVARLMHEFPQYDKDIVALAQAYRPDFVLPRINKADKGVDSQEAVMAAKEDEKNAGTLPVTPPPAASPYQQFTLGQPLPLTEPLPLSEPLPLLPASPAAPPVMPSSAPSQPQPIEVLDSRVEAGHPAIPPTVNFYEKPLPQPLTRDYDLKEEARTWRLPASLELSLRGAATGSETVFLEAMRRLIKDNPQYADRIVDEAKGLKPQLSAMIDIYNPATVAVKSD